MKRTNKIFTINEIYNGDALHNLDEGELLFHYIHEGNVNLPIRAYVLSHIDLLQLKTAQRDMTVFEAFEEFADDDQVEIVESYISEFDDITPIVTMGDVLLDGYHRCVAAILTSRSILSIDLSNLS